jgi:transposase InsO family protein
LLPEEVAAILDLVERWGPVDRSHRKLAHRGSYEQLVWVSPSSLRRVLITHEVTLPEPLARTRSERKPWPDWLVWEPNRIWIWDVTHFIRARRVCFAIIDMVSRKWIATLVSVEETATQVQVLFEHALEVEGLPELLTDERLDLDPDDPRRPILLAVSDNGRPMTAHDTRAFMALMAIACHHGRPVVPHDQAWIESFFGHIKGEWPHLETITGPAVLEAELVRVRSEYNTVRLHESIGYVTPTTNTAVAGRPSAKPAATDSSAPGNAASTTIAGTPRAAKASASSSRTSASVASASRPRSTTAATTASSRSSSVIGPRADRIWRTAASIASNIAPTLPARRTLSAADRRAAAHEGGHFTPASARRRP